jgi:hypothetical protein
VFWKSYPLKVSKKDAIKAFNKVKPSEELLTKMLKAIEIAKTTKKWQEGYAPNPATWLNGERWNDEIPTSSQAEDKWLVR